MQREAADQIVLLVVVVACCRLNSCTASTGCASGIALQVWFQLAAKERREEKDAAKGVRGHVGKTSTLETATQHNPAWHCGLKGADTGATFLDPRRGDWITRETILQPRVHWPLTSHRTATALSPARRGWAEW